MEQLNRLIKDVRILLLRLQISSNVIISKHRSHSIGAVLSDVSPKASPNMS